MKRFLTAALVASSCGSASADTLLLQDGDVINAPVVARDTEGVTIEHPSLGEIKIPHIKIKAEYKDADALKAALAEQAAAEKAAALEAERSSDDGLGGSGLLQGWNRQLELGLNGSSGNSENATFRAGFKGDYEDDRDRWLLDMLYRRAVSDGVVSDNNFYAELTKDWLLPEHDYFYFGNLRYDWDDFQDWEHRASAFGGIGYQFIETDKLNLRGRAGLGGNQEFGSADEGFTPEALLGVEADYKIADNQSIGFSNTLYPSLEEAGEFRNITTLDYIININRDKGMDLKIGVANEYDSKVSPGTKKSDFDYYIALVWKF